MSASRKALSTHTWSRYIGKDVKITWKSSAHDWKYFHVIAAQGNISTLRGIDDPETGDKHIGNSFDADWYELRSIVEIEHRPPKFDGSYKELIEDGVLDKAQKIVDGRDKQEHYGPPEEFMGRLAKLWGGYLGVEVKPTDAALMMALLKAARLRTNPHHEDSLVDFAGYAHIYSKIKGAE